MILSLDVTAAGEQIRMSKSSVPLVKNTIVKIVWIPMIYATARIGTTVVINGKSFAKIAVNSSKLVWQLQ